MGGVKGRAKVTIKQAQEQKKRGVRGGFVDILPRDGCGEGRISPSLLSSFSDLFLRWATARSVVDVDKAHPPPNSAPLSHDTINKRRTATRLDQPPSSIQRATDPIPLEQRGLRCAVPMQRGSIAHNACECVPRPKSVQSHQRSDRVGAHPFFF